MTALYTDGTITLVNGSPLITGIDTAWKVSGIVGGTLFAEVDGGTPLPILPTDSDGENQHPITDTQMTAAIKWTGPSGTYKYAIVRETSYNRQQALNAEKLGDLLSQLDEPMLAALSSIVGVQDSLILITGPSTASLIPRTSLVQGADYDVQVNALSDRAAYDAQPGPTATARGFAVLVSNIGNGLAAIYSKKSNTSGDWTVAAPITGAKGDQGNPGPYTTIQIGTVTTLNPGEPATITQTQVSPGVIRLDFGLPKGLDGTGTGDVIGPNGGVTAKQIAGFGSTTGKAIVGLTAAEARAASATPVGNFRNKIINPLFSINQRAVSGTVNLAAGAYGHDRMKAGSNGCTYNFSVNNGVTTLNITAGSLQQVIEASSFAGEAGNYVLSWAGTAQGRINGGTYGASGAVTATIDGSANVTIELTGGTVSLPTFEKDYVTPFAARHRQQEMSLCQRYYHWQSEFQMFPMSTVANALGRRGQLFFSSEMRVVPTVAYTPRSEIANSNFSANVRFITFTSNVNSNDNWGIIDNVRIDAEL